MARATRPLERDEFNYLETDDTGALFWKGKKVRLGGWTVGDRTGVAALVIAFLTFVVLVIEKYSAIKGFISRIH